LSAEEGARPLDTQGRGARALLAGAALVFAVVALAGLVAPRLTLSVGAASVFVFAGVAVSAVLGVFLGTRAHPARRVAALVALVAVALLAAVALGHPPPRLGAPLVDAALVALAIAVGGAIGARIEHPGHLLPASVVAACADVISVVSPSGPSHAIVADARALAILALSFPVPGTREAAPALGLGDVVFLALLLAAARTHALPAARVAALSLLGIALAGVASAALEAAVPALPAIVACVIVGVPAARRVRRRDRTVTWIAVGAAVLLATGAVARRGRETPVPAPVGSTDRSTQP
jgi:hypothetical protein